jgi:hypothetical protein
MQRMLKMNQIRDLRGLDGLLKFIMLIGIALILAFITYNLYVFAKGMDGFIFLDWLINYHDGGFKRRGLGGSFFFVIHDITHISLVKLVFLTQVSFYMFFLVVLCKIILSKAIDLKFLVFLFSPLTFLFFVNDPDGIGRKEVILYAIFTLYTYWVSTNSLTRLKEHLVLALLFLATFWHELMFFYTPYFLLIRYFHSNDQKFEFSLRTALYLLAGLLPLLIILIWGTEINNGNSIKLLNDRGIFFSNGIFMWKDSALEWWSNNGFQPYLWYTVPVVYGFLMLYFYWDGIKVNKLKSGFYFLIGCFLFSAPLFFLAIDWGRWIAIHFTMILVMLGSLLPSKMENLNEIKQNYKVEISTVIFLLANFLFMMPHVRTGFKFNSILLSIFG